MIDSLELDVRCVSRSDPGPSPMAVLMVIVLRSKLLHPLLERSISSSYRSIAAGKDLSSRPGIVLDDFITLVCNDRVF